MRIIALVVAASSIVVGASGIAAADPIDAILDSDDLPDTAQQTQLRDYLAHNPTDVDRAVIAGVKLGDATWRAACPLAPSDGLCVRRVSLVKAPRGTLLRCGEGAERHVVVARDARKTTDAAAALHRAELAFERTWPASPPTSARTRAYYARARLLDADRGFEANASQALPALDFDPSRPPFVAASKAKLAAWADARRAAASRLAGDYTAIAALGDRDTTLAVAARIAQLAASFAETLSLAEVPAAVRAEPIDSVYAYCDSLAVVAEPLETAATTAFEKCMAKSAELHWFNDFSRLCERELAQRKPNAWPPLTERHATAGQTRTITDLAPPE